MIYQFSSNFLFPTIFGLVLIIETLLCPSVEASETVTIKAYCTENASDPSPVYDTVEIRLKDCETLGYVKKEVKCENEGISYAFIFEREQNQTAVIHTEMTTDGRNIQCVDYEDEEDSERQKTLEIKAYCTGHRSNPVPVYADVQRRLDACKQLGNVYWGVESEIGSFRFYYTFKYERKTGQNRTECDDHEDENDKELKEHLSFYYHNGRDELLASLLRSYHNAKKELKERAQSYMNPQVYLDDLMEARRLYLEKKNEWETYYNKKKEELKIMKKRLNNEKLDTQMEKKLKIGTENHSEKEGEETIDHGAPMTVEQELRRRKGKNVIVSSPSQQ
ncbi:hypothetical protein niasHT_031752 [Heterodera trifolii]|uniref:Effector protein n=1 Tax=Heterodera trifolii TaxID=157864 RepID=A0ABD2IJ83_9BILA